MAGGLMQLVSEGQQNIILNGNPTKTFFKATYARYTNFGMQKFRVDFDGSKTLRLSEESNFTFKIPRYADLLMDCYLSVELPNIWSPIMPPTVDETGQMTNDGDWVPYEFKWIESLGALMISRITITCGNQTLQDYTGDYIKLIVERELTATKKILFDSMIGNIPILNDPANSGARVNSYPNAYYAGPGGSAEPSIRGRTLYIPLNSWFNYKSQMAFPLVALQYNELHINVTMRPIQELFRIRDVFDAENNYPYVAPNFNLWYMQFYRFLQTPPSVGLGIADYTDTRTLWNADIHLNCTYCFLSNEESRVFALQEQKYLFNQVRRQKFYNVTGTNKVQLDSVGMVANYMFYFQRSDVNLRNEWSNYSNWPYNYLPYDITPAPTDGTYPIARYNPDGSYVINNIGPGVNASGDLTGWYITGNYNLENRNSILTSMGILLDGNYRENDQPVGVFNYVEKWNRTGGNLSEGVYFFSFGMSNSPLDFQPAGAINMSRFNLIELEFSTILPTLDPYAQSLAICDPVSNQIVGINKPTWRIYNYNYDLTLFEERINQVTFVGGNCGLMYAT
jgi:hypothetical protein